jgi:hypothetical protein
MNNEHELSTDAELCKSLFYPACGTDLQPVLMTADKVQTFVYADWNRAEAEVVEAFQSQTHDGLHLLGSAQIPQEQYGRACLRTVNMNPRSRYFGQYVMVNEYEQSLSELFPAGFQLSNEELAAYDQRRRTAIGVSNPWVREFVFNYTGGSEPRTLKLLYFSDEGLARYCVLFHKRRLAPQFVCTIQSGPGFGHGWTMLEQAGGTFERFLLACDPRPNVWIRKVWPGDRLAGYWNQPVAEYESGSIRAFVHGENP